MGNSNIGLKTFFDINEVTFRSRNLLEAGRGQILRLYSKISCNISFRDLLGWEIQIMGLKYFLTLMRLHFGLKICWRLAEDRFRGYTVKYHMTYH